MDKWTAGYTYEGIVQRKLDPSILYKKTKTNYEMKIYPLLGNSYRIVKIKYFIPNVWNKLDIKTLLPFDFKNVSYKPIESIDVIIFPDSNFTKPLLENSMNVNFTYSQSPRYGNGYRGTLNVNLVNSPTIVMQHKLKDSIFVSINEFEDENFYQAIIPLENYEINRPKKFLFLLDFEENKSNYTKDSLIKILERSITEVLYDQDVFNVFYSSASNDIRQLGNDWIKADRASIESAFRFLNQDSLKTGTNLENLLLQSADWVQNQMDSLEVMIISNSDSHGSMEIGNELGPKFLDKIGNKSRISVASFLQKNWKSYSIFGIGYAANDYLYNGLIRLSQGYFTKIFDFQHNLQLFLNSSIQNISGGYTNIKFSIQPTNGFAYDQYELIDASKNEYKFYAETGKFLGSPPIDFVFTGFFRESPFQKIYHIDQIETNYDNKSIWGGARLRYLENQNGSQNMMIYKIINESLKYHVLSVFTAFLALDDFEKYHLDKDVVIPVEFLSFEGEIIGNKAVLNWATASEKNNYGFYIDRSSSENSDWQNIGFVAGAGTSSNRNYYNFQIQISKSITAISTD